MKRFSISALLLLALPTLPAAGHGTERLLEGRKCHASAERVLDRWEPERIWKPFLSPEAEVVHRTPTRKIGTWIELKLLKDGGLEVIRLSPTSSTKITWEPKRCAPKLASALIRRDEGRMKDTFDDSRFEAVAAANPQGILYVWSPHMPYSLKGWEPLQRAARKTGLPVFAVLDPHASALLLSEMPSEFNTLKASSRRLEAWELIQRGVGQHYPTTVLFSRGRVVGPVFPGVKSEGQYVAFIKEYLSQD